MQGKQVLPLQQGWPRKTRNSPRLADPRRSVSPGDAEQLQLGQRRLGSPLSSADEGQHRVLGGLCPGSGREARPSTGSELFSVAARAIQDATSTGRPRSVRMKGRRVERGSEGFGGWGGGRVSGSARRTEARARAGARLRREVGMQPRGRAHPGSRGDLLRSCTVWAPE